jgi:hypothetical protein
VDQAVTVALVAHTEQLEQAEVVEEVVAQA